jgi:hypothetical protein
LKEDAIRTGANRYGISAAGGTATLQVLAQAGTHETRRRAGEGAGMPEASQASIAQLRDRPAPVTKAVIRGGLADRSLMPSTNIRI